MIAPLKDEVNLLKKQLEEQKSASDKKIALMQEELLLMTKYLVDSCPDEKVVLGGQ